jgi:hypothetical protein
MTAHWGIEDPAAIEGQEFRRKAAFEDALRFIRNRITTACRRTCWPDRRRMAVARRATSRVLITVGRFRFERSPFSH